MFAIDSTSSDEQVKYVFAYLGLNVQEAYFKVGSIIL